MCNKKCAGDVTCLATMTPDIQAEAQFLAKANGVVAGIALADMVFNEVDPSLKVIIYCA
jgi:nicotinate-nucleotide pyrophosphorylase (carboxylating)